VKWSSAEKNVSLVTIKIEVVFECGLNNSVLHKLEKRM
jgi:hypothetical protein